MKQWEFNVFIGALVLYGGLAITGIVHLVT